LFRVIKRQFGYTKVYFRGLVKNTAQMVTFSALSNLWMACRHFLSGAERCALNEGNSRFKALAAEKWMK